MNLFIFGLCSGSGVDGYDLTYGKDLNVGLFLKTVFSICICCFCVCSKCPSNSSSIYTTLNLLHFHNVNRRLDSTSSICHMDHNCNWNYIHIFSICIFESLSFDKNLDCIMVCVLMCKLVQLQCFFVVYWKLEIDP